MSRETLTPRYFVDAQGVLLGVFHGLIERDKDGKIIKQVDNAPKGAGVQEVPTLPPDSSYRWQGSAWVPGPGPNLQVLRNALVTQIEANPALNLLCQLLASQRGETLAQILAALRALP